MAFQSIPDSDNYNSVSTLETNFDVNGDGTQLTDTFSLFHADILGTGDLLDLRFTYQLDANDEDIALDNLTVSGIYNKHDNKIPEPSVIILLVTGLFGVYFVKLRSKVFST